MNKSINRPGKQRLIKRLARRSRRAAISASRLISQLISQPSNQGKPSADARFASFATTARISPETNPEITADAPHLWINTGRSTARGFTLIGALFLIVVLAGLLVFMLTLATTSAHTATQAYRQTQALAVAQAGLEWGAYQTLVAGAACNGTPTLPAAQLDDYTVVVSCSSSTHTEQGETLTVYQINASASAGIYGQPYYVQRRVRTVVSVAPP